MTEKALNSSPHNLTVLQRAARLYEGERWWIASQGQVRGLLLLDGEQDLAGLRQEMIALAARGYGFTVEAEVMDHRSRPSGPATPRQRDCQVTIEERSQLFGFLKKG